MNQLVRFVLYLFSRASHLYPRRFRDEFAREMQDVFKDALNEAIKDGILPLLILCLRELGGLPFNILREFWHEFQRRETMLLHENILNPPEKSTTTGYVIIGSLPFFLFGLIMILLELPLAWLQSEWFNALGGILFVMWLILPAIGFSIGWIQMFPRWSYPHTGMALILALYIGNVTTPGLNLFGIPIFERELWGWRAWIPLAVTFTGALVVSRSFRPFFRFFSNLWQDWSIPSYLMAGVMPLLVMAAFDEIDRLYSLYFMVVFAMLLVAMVVFYLRSQYAWQRVLVLTIGVLAILFPAVLGSNSYWLAHRGTSLSGAREMLALAGKISVIMLLPSWLELIRRLVGHLRTQ